MTRLLVCIFAFLFSLSAIAQNNTSVEEETAARQNSSTYNKPINAFFDDPININPFAQFYIAEQNQLLSDIRRLNNWQINQDIKDIPDNSVLWVRFQIENNTNTNIMLTLIAGSVFVDRVDVYLLDDQGRITQSGRSLDSQHKGSNLNRKSFKMDMLSRAESIYTVYVRIQDDGQVQLPIELWQSEDYSKETSIRLILIGAMSGGLALLATYFLLTYVLRNARARFWFCLFATAAMTTMLTAEGVLTSLLNIPTMTAELTCLSLIVTYFAAIKITRNVFRPMSSWFLRVNYALLIVTFVCIFVLNDLHKMIAVVVFATLFTISKITAIVLYKRVLDMRSVGIYLAGWFSLCAVGLIEFIKVSETTSHLSYTAAYPFALTCLGVLLVAVAIISREQAVQSKRIYKQSEQIEQLQKYNDLFEHAAEGLYTALPNGDLIHVNPATCSLFGYADNDSFLASHPNLASIFANPVEADLLFGELSIQQTVLGKEVKGKRKDGSEFWFSISCQLTKVNDEQLHFGSLFDITERRLHQINLQYLNTHDQLTGLFNRRHFIHVMNQRISEQTHESAKFALLFLDVDQFKVINDTCGHSAGDIFIKELSHELFDVVSDKYPFARLSADQFALLVQFNHSDELRALAQQLLAKVRTFEFKWDRHLFNQSVSIGIAPYDETIPSGEELLSYADTACLIAKESGRDKIHIYSSEMGMHSSYKRELFWVNEVRTALKEHKFELHYQHYRPLNKVDELQYYEILVRLRTDEDDLVTPEFFMPSAEKAHISNTIDKQVVEMFFTFLQDNPAHLDKLGKANINLSGFSLSDDDFAFFLLNAFEKYQVPYNKICFEITETMAIIKMKDAVEFIQKFKELGCTFALDDFGSGFSSYNYLKHLPVDFVKIDGNFIRDILNDPIDLAMVTSIRDVADAMQIKTVAEFVESTEIMVQLGKLGVDFAQGFCIAEPVSLSEYQDYTDSK